MLTFDEAYIFYNSLWCLPKLRGGILGDYYCPCVTSLSVKERVKTIVLVDDKVFKLHLSAKG